MGHKLSNGDAVWCGYEPLATEQPLTAAGLELFVLQRSADRPDTGKTRWIISGLRLGLLHKITG